MYTYSRGLIVLIIKALSYKDILQCVKAGVIWCKRLVSWQNKDENIHRYEVRGGKSLTFGDQKNQRCIRLGANWFCSKTSFDL